MKDKKCPLPEIISAFYDKALGPASPEAIHIRACPQCNRILNSYAAIARALKSMRDERNASELVKNITDGVHRKLLVPPPRVIPFTKQLLRIAASAFIGGCALYFAASSMLKTGGGQIVAPAALPALAPATAKQEQYPYYTGDSSTSGGLENSVPLQSLVNVDFGNSFNPVFKLDGNDKSDNPAPISGSVHQVWVVPDVNAASGAFKHLLKRYGIPEKNICSTGGGNSFKARAVMTKGQLVQLVKSCKAAGFELTTPQQPQPEQNTFLGRAGDPVFLSVELLQNAPLK